MSRSQFIDEAKWKSMSDYKTILSIHRIFLVYTKNENIFKTAWTHPYINYKYLCLFQKQYLNIVH